MYIESNDPEGAKVYDMIIRQILQDLVLPPSIDDMRAYVNPNEVCFIIAITPQEPLVSFKLLFISTA